MNIEKRTEQTPLGQATLVKITNDHGSWVELSSLGAGIVSAGVPDRHGNIENVALNYASAASYADDGPCMGKVPGRYANRIADGHFSIDGKEYALAINNGPNALHGGPTGFQNRIWECRPLPNGVRFEYESADGEEGYPGNLKVTADYVWSENNILDLYLRARTDRPTVVNLTNHTYWNLRGAYKGDALQQQLQLKASSYLPTDATLVPTGILAPVEGTPMDFREMKRLGEDIEADFEALRHGKGYDACWAIDNWRKGMYVADAVVLHDPESGRTLSIGTTQPGVQVYTGNWLDGCPEAPAGHHYSDYDGVAIECQGFPDAPNKPRFPSQRLDPAGVYDEHIRFSFTTED